MKYQFSANESLQITFREKGIRGIPYDCALNFKLETEDYRGSSSCWIEGEDLSGFCAELKSLEKTLKGMAQLTSASPGELNLKINPINSLGLFVLQVELGSKKIIDRSLFDQSVKSAFELEAQMVIKFCKEFLNYIEGALND